MQMKWVLEKMLIYPSKAWLFPNHISPPVYITLYLVIPQHLTPGSNLTLHDEVMIGRHTTLGEGSDVPGGSTKSSPDRVMLGGLKVIAGSASSSHCSRCERRVNETVCGANGQTFPTLCHAINCGGLSLNDITYGNCRNKVSDATIAPTL